MCCTGPVASRACDSGLRWDAVTVPRLPSKSEQLRAILQWVKITYPPSNRSSHLDLCPFVSLSHSYSSILAGPTLPKPPTCIESDGSKYKIRVYSPYPDNIYMSHNI